MVAGWVGPIGKRAPIVFLCSNGRAIMTETIDQILNSDIAARFDITREQAERIADRAKDGADFVRIWENQDWWL
jgi:diacylglycerol kinase